MLDEEVIADGVEGVFIEAVDEGFGEAFVEFEIEDLKAERLGRTQFSPALCQSRGIVRGRIDDQPHRLENSTHRLFFWRASLGRFATGFQGLFDAFSGIIGQGVFGTGCGLAMLRGSAQY